MPSAGVVLFYLGMLGIAALWASWTDPGLAMLWRAPVTRTVPGVAAGVGVGLGLVVVTMLAEPWVPALRRLAEEIAEVVAPVTAGRVMTFALASGIAEEALFRGPVQHSVGFVLASVGFALLHGGISSRYIAWSTFALLAGLSFGVLAEAYQSIWPPAIAHVVVNGINLARLARIATAADGEDKS